MARSRKKCAKALSTQLKTLRYKAAVRTVRLWDASRLPPKNTCDAHCHVCETFTAFAQTNSIPCEFVVSSLAHFDYFIQVG